MNGKPFSSETYHAPSGPMAIAVGTDSAGVGVPGGGPGNGRSRRPRDVFAQEPRDRGDPPLLVDLEHVVAGRVGDEHAAARQHREAERVRLLGEVVLVVLVRVGGLVGSDVHRHRDPALAVEAHDPAASGCGVAGNRGPDVARALVGDLDRAGRLRIRGKLGEGRTVADPFRRGSIRTILPLPESATNSVRPPAAVMPRGSESPSATTPSGSGRAVAVPTAVVSTTTSAAITPTRRLLATVSPFRRWVETDSQHQSGGSFKPQPRRLPPSRPSPSSRSRASLSRSPWSSRSRSRSPTRRSSSSRCPSCS